MTTDTSSHSNHGYSELRTHWRTLLCVTVAASFGFPTLIFFSIGVFAPILSAEFDWAVGSIMAGLFIAALTLMLGGPFVGRYIDKKGPRRLAAMSFIALGVSYMSLAFSTGSLLQYYLSWLVLSITGLGATVISFTHIINGVFIKRRGIALGIALSSSGISAVLVKSLAGVTIGLLGWRETIILVGILPILISAPVMFWGLPKHIGITASKNPGEPAQDKPQEGLTLSEAVKKPAFWILLVAFTAIAFGNGAPIPNFESILVSQAFSTEEIITITSTIGLSLIVGRICGGWLIDQFWAPLIGFVMISIAAVGCWMLSVDTVTLSQALIATVLISLAAGIEYDLLAFLVARYLGRRSYGVIYSIIFGAFAISSGLGPLTLGSLYDRFDSYSLGLILCAGMLFFAAITLLALGRYPRALPNAENSH